MSAEADWPWSVLGLDGPPEDPRDVRRAYARLVKSEDWSTNVAGFEELRRAYEWAQRLTGEGTSRRRVVSADLFEQEPARPRPTIVPENRPEPSPELARDIPEEEGFHAEAPPQAGEGTDADTEQPAEPQPSPWQRDPRQQLWEQLNYQLENRRYDVAALKQALASPAMDDPETRQRVERTLVNHIAAWMPPERWITAADDRFNWRNDGVGFMKRHPSRADAYQKIIAGVRVSMERQAPPATKFKHGSPWAVFIWTFVSAMILFGISLQFNSARVIPILGIVALIALMAVGLAHVVLNLIVFRLLKLFPWSHRKLNMMLRWWAKPVRGIRKPIILCVSVVLLAVGLSLPGIANMDDRPLPSGISAGVDTNRLYRSLGLPSGVDFEDPQDRQMVSVPRFVTVLGIKPDGEDLYANGGPALLDLSAAQTPFAGGPAAILRCIAPGRCQLATRLDMEVLRIIPVDGGADLIGKLSKPLLHLETRRQETVTASWINAQHDDYVAYIGRKLRNGGERQFRLTVGMFVAAISYAGGAKQFDRPSMDMLPLDSLDTGIALRFDWPADQKSAMTCVEQGPGAGMRLLAECGVDFDTLQPGETWLCPPQSNAGSCAYFLSRLSGYDPAQLDLLADRVEGNSVSPWPDKTNDLLQKLLKRMTLGGSHPPLPDSPEMRALHAQVLGDYALILDRPSAAKYRTDRDRLRAALARQPQLFEAARAEPEVRDKIWAGFLRNLDDLGFPPPPAEVAQATVSRP